MAISDYSNPVAQLLQQGECSSHEVRTWMDYQSLGLSRNDIPSLIAMATDHELYRLDAEASEGWAPIHAWRALGQLRSIEAVDPLLQYAKEYIDHDGWWDWMAVELPRIFAMIGEELLPNLAIVVHDRTRPAWVRVIAVEGLEKLAEQSDSQSSVYQQSVQIFLEEVNHFAENDPDFNGFLIGTLAKLRVMEAVPLIEQAFASGKVDEMISGDWGEIQVKLGLKSREEVPRKPVDPRFLKYLESLDRAASIPSGFGDRHNQPARSNRKAKQKQQSDSRRKNRKKK